MCAVIAKAAGKHLEGLVVLLSMQIWATSPRNLQLPMAVLENENSWLGGWVNALMVAVLLTYTKLPEADIESSLLLTCCVGSGTCRALFPKEVQSPNYP